MASIRTSLQPALDFLAELAEHNSREWFNANRASYEEAHAAFEAFVESMIVGLEKTEDLGGVTARDSMMRIYRDMRFSRDKTPYRTNFGASIVAGGRKSGRLGYYVQIQPRDHSFIAGGLYEPSADQIARFRRAIARDASEFHKICKASAFRKYFGALEGERLSRPPQGYAPDHPEIELLKLRQVLVMHPVTDREVAAADFDKHALLVCKAMRPFNDYLNRVLG